MKRSNYFYVAHSQMYGMLHGMHTGGCLNNVTLEDAKEIARTEAYDVVTGYDCIMNDIYDNLNEEFGYDETPEDPNEEYLDALKNVNIPFMKSHLRARHIGMKWKQTMSLMKIM